MDPLHPQVTVGLPEANGRAPAPRAFIMPPTGVMPTNGVPAFNHPFDPDGPGRFGFGQPMVAGGPVMQAFRKARPF